ncbi:MAG TPA: sulfite exporter TauE/SafE family protein [Dehalococcoidia bacterium]|nr:sulfite exporter TauE/SafE family protein [Dehalococcoidia bacterium]
MADALVWPGLVLLGVAVGAYGTLIGAGGGFLLVPLLLLLYPGDPPELLTSISLAAVFFNALSGTIAYLRQRRIDYLAANAFALATVPGAILGALAVGLFPRDLFDAVFGVVLLAVAVFLTIRPTARMVQRVHRRGEVTRRLTDAHGDTYFYSYNIAVGISFSVLVGFVSSLLGIGGGIIHVPLMVQALHFPAHIATATSHYVLTVSALTGTLVHVVNGSLDGGYLRAGALALGMVLGAQLGALLSLRIGGVAIIRLMAAALALIAVRLLVTAAWS